MRIGILSFVVTAGLVAAFSVACSSTTSSTTPAGDAGKPATTAGDGAVTPPTGTGDAAKPTPTTPPTGDDGSTPPATGCAAPATVSYTPVPSAFKDPFWGTNNCTTAQMTAFNDACLGTTGDATKCKTWYSDAANAACWGCIFPEATTASPTNSGFIVPPGSVNLAGCFAHFDKPCGEKVWEANGCQAIACDDNKGGNCEGVTDQTVLDKCNTDAENGACGTYWTAAEAVCAVDGGLKPSLAPCQKATGEQDSPYLLRLLNLFCGTGS